jgi:hypothetical protein
MAQFSIHFILPSGYVYSENAQLRKYERKQVAALYGMRLNTAKLPQYWNFGRDISRMICMHGRYFEVRGTNLLGLLAAPPFIMH